MRVSGQGQDDSGKGPAASDRRCGLDMVRSFVSLTQMLPGPKDSLDCRVCVYPKVCVQPIKMFFLSSFFSLVFFSKSGH